MEPRPSVSHDGSLDSQENLDDVPIELRHLEPDDPSLLDIPPSPALPRIGVATDCHCKESKSRSLSDLVGAQPVSPAESLGSHLGGSRGFLVDISDPLMGSSILSNVLRSKSSSSCLSLSSNSSFIDGSSAPSVSGLSINSDKSKTSDSKTTTTDTSIHEESPRVVRKRPVLTKQKRSINENDGETPIIIEISDAERVDESKMVPPTNENKDYLTIPKLSGIIKQSSLNDEFICLDRFMEKEKIKQSIQKQSSLNEDLIYGNKEQKQESLRDSLFKAQFKRLQFIRESFQRLRTASLDRFEKERPESLKNGLVKLLQSWKSEILLAKEGRSSDKDGDGQTRGESSKYKNEDTNSQRLYKTNGDSFDSNGETKSPIDKKFLGREFSERKLSTEDGSDSSKENSLQSDTSLDSEESSCISVIFVPNPGQGGSSDKERNKSISSESSEGSDKQHSPKSPKSPNSPKSPSNCTGRYFPSNRFLGTKNTKMGNQILPGSAPRQTSPPSSDTSAVSDVTLSITGTTVSSQTIIEEPSFLSEEDTVPDEPKPQESSYPSSLSPLVDKICTNPRFLSLDSKVDNDAFVSKPQITESISLKSSPVYETSSIGETMLPKSSSVTETLSSKTFDFNEKRNYLSKPLLPHEKVVLPPIKLPKITIKRSSIPEIPPFKPSNEIKNKSASTSSSLGYQSGIGSILKPLPSSPSSESHKQSKSGKFSSKYGSKRDTVQISSLLCGENIEIIRKPTVQGGRNVQIVRKTIPKFLTFEVFNPETDDLDSDSSASSSPNSEGSVIETGWPTERVIEELDREIKRREEEEKLRPSPQGGANHDRVLPPAELPKISLVEPVHRMDTINEEAQASDSSK